MNLGLGKNTPKCMRQNEIRIALKESEIIHKWVQPAFRRNSMLIYAACTGFKEFGGAG